MLVRRRRLIRDTECILEVDGRPRATHAIGDGVARDRVQPGQKRFALPAVAFDVRERACEHLACQVLSVRGVAHAVEEVAVDTIDVLVVQLSERFAVAAARPGDHVGRFVRSGLRDRYRNLCDRHSIPLV